MIHDTTMLSSRFWARVDKNGPDGFHSQTGEQMGPCWLWLGKPCPNGYGRFRSTYAHRAAYEALVGPLMPGMEIDHLCRTRACCNPMHLEQVSPRANRQRVVHMPVTRCLRGHDYDAANTRYNADGTRFCRECQRARYYEKERPKRMARQTCRNGHPFDSVTITKRGRPRKIRFCPTCHAKRTVSRWGNRDDAAMT